MNTARIEIRITFTNFKETGRPLELFYTGKGRHNFGELRVFFKLFPSPWKMS